MDRYIILLYRRQITAFKNEWFIFITKILKGALMGFTNTFLSVNGFYYYYSKFDALTQSKHCLAISEV